MDRKSNYALFLFCLIAPAILLFPFFSSSCLARNVTLGWNANSEPDLEGYVIYRNTGSPGPPYGYSNDLPEDDLANPLHPRVTLTGLRDGRKYYIAITAYNTGGLESRFSNAVCVEFVNGIVGLCSASSGPGDSRSVSSRGGGGGGGGCFINSVGDDLNNADLLGVIFVFGVLVLGAFELVVFVFRQDLQD